MTAEWSMSDTEQQKSAASIRTALNMITEMAAQMRPGLIDVGAQWARAAESMRNREPTP